MEFRWQLRSCPDLADHPDAEPSATSGGGPDGRSLSPFWLVFMLALVGRVDETGLLKISHPREWQMRFHIIGAAVVVLFLAGGCLLRPHDDRPFPNAMDSSAVLGPSASVGGVYLDNAKVGAFRNSTGQPIPMKVRMSSS